MSFIPTTTYVVDRNFNDFGSRISRIGFAGKVEVTILDNLYKASQLLQGRILSGPNIPGGFRLYISRGDLRELVAAYSSLTPYKLSPDLEPLVQTLQSLLQRVSTDVEIGLDNRVILQLINVNNVIALGLSSIWEGVIGLRMISNSGFNKDVTIDGKQQILDANLARIRESEMQFLQPIFEKAGQLAGIRAPRQVEMRDMISDLLFSRRESYATLNELFYTTRKQRNTIREFRTDILFCPVSRYRELESGKNIQPLIHITKPTTDADSSIKIEPNGFDEVEFTMTNIGLDPISLSIAGSIDSGAYTLLPSQTIRASGTSFTLQKADYSNLKYQIWADIRDFQLSGDSIVSLALGGKLKDNDDLSHLFYQIIAPVMPYLPAFVKRIKTSEILNTLFSTMAPFVVNVLKTLQPGHLYSGWFLTDNNSSGDRMFYIYMLTIMLPEMLLDPTFTFSKPAGTPPYIQEYSQFAENLRKLYN